ncbi:MAG: type II toxin-antitoxin system RelE/ParE family toxin [Moraxellaceae bacterium]|nr:type II toxin-antitoxin system RelE/ParE family toxin [Moraxellaceae bacterium]
MKLWVHFHAPTLIEDFTPTIQANLYTKLLKGDRIGYYSMHINDQWRICFRWQRGSRAYDVEIVDYH